ncbi:MAG: hypothetical protein V4713_01635 [Pseudomonadota bacterium]
MKYLALVLSTSVLVACGGGGGGGATVSLAPTPTAALNMSNQTAAAQDTTSTAFMPIWGTRELTGAQVTDESVLFSIARDQLDKLPTYMANAQANQTLTGAVQSQTSSCPLGGSLTVSVNDADNSTLLSAGDSFTIVYSNCVLNSATLSGSLGFVFNSLSGSYQSPASTNYTLGITMNYGNFTVTGSGLIASMNGSMTFAAIANGVNTLSETISTPSLTVSGTYGGLTRSRSLTGYSATVTKIPDVTYGYLKSYSMSGAVTSSALSAQAISFATSTPLVLRGTDGYPSSGVMVISGANNSKIKLTALSSTQIQQDLDANGDGSYETTSTVNWNTLL